MNEIYFPVNHNYNCVRIINSFLWRTIKPNRWVWIPPYVRVMANYLIRKQRRDISFFFQILWLISNLWNRFNSKFCWQHGRIEIFLPEEYSSFLTILTLSKQRRFHRASEKRINDANTVVVMVYRKINFIQPITIQY